MTENEKKESGQTEESSESTVFISADKADGNSNNSGSSGASPAAAGKAEEPGSPAETPEASPSPAVAEAAVYNERASGSANSSCTHDGEHETQRQVPMYVGLSILFILCLFYYNLTKSKEQAREITQIGTSVSEIGSKIGGLNQQISGFEQSLTRYEQSILGLELKRSLVTVEEVISKSDKQTLNAAIRARAALRSLINSITAASSAGSKYMVKQISSVKKELPALSVIKKEAGNTDIGKSEKGS